MKELLKYSANAAVIDFIDENLHHVYGRTGCLEKLKPKTLPGNIEEKRVPFGFENNQLKAIETLKDHIHLIYDARKRSR